MRKLFAVLVPLLLLACSAPPSITFSTQQGQCNDGSANAPYCMSITVQNNSGGQNYITSVSSFNNLSFSLSGPSNVAYPNTQGSPYDPNGCMSMNFTAGTSCTFYLKLTGESVPVGLKVPVTVNLSYTLYSSSTLPYFSSGSNGSSSVTVYETPTLYMSFPQYGGGMGYIESYSANGVGAPFLGESGDTVLNSVTNDNYYGYLYLSGNNGIYYSGNGTYVGNTTNSTTSITGASNVMVSGQSLYASPNGTNYGSIWAESIPGLTFQWGSFATGGLPTIAANNINAINGANVFVAINSSSQQVYYCTSSSSSGGNGCNPEGFPFNPESQVTAIGYTSLSPLSNGTSLTGLVVGTSSGLFIESGTLGLNTNSWIPATYSQTTAGATYPLSNRINAITRDNNFNLYVADNQGNIYILMSGNTTNLLFNTLWSQSLNGMNISSMVVDNSANLPTLYVFTNNQGAVFSCPSGAGCTKVLNNNTYTGGVTGLNIITSLTSS